MSDLFVGMEGAKRLLDKVEKKRLQIEANHERAARSAANVFRRYVRLEAKAIRGRGAFAGLTKTGRRRSKHLLERDVVLEPVPIGFIVRDKAPHAHLVVRGTKAHRIVPSGAAGSSRKGVELTPARLEGLFHKRGFAGPVNVKHALSFVVGGEQLFRPAVQNPGAKPNPFVHRGFLAAGKEPLIAARVVLFENGPEVTE